MIEEHHGLYQLIDVNSYNNHFTIAVYETDPYIEFMKCLILKKRTNVKSIEKKDEHINVL